MEGDLVLKRKNLQIVNREENEGMDEQKRSRRNNNNIRDSNGVKLSPVTRKDSVATMKA